MAWGAVALSLSLVIGGAAAPAVAADATFADPNLTACVNGALGQGATDPITDTQASSISTLSCIGAGITDLDGIRQLTSLQYLDLNGNDLVNIGELGLVTTLVQLNLSGTGIDDLSALSPLTSLSTLLLTGNRITDLSPLAPLTNLSFLDLASNQITDVTALAGLTSLERLHLHFNRISDVTALAGLSSMRYLLLVSNRIADVSSLSGIAGSLDAPDQYIDAGRQSVALPAVTAGSTQPSPVRGFDAGIAPVAHVFGPATVASDGRSWTFTAAGTSAFSWTAADPGTGAGMLTFSGDILQESSVDTTPSTLVDDSAITAMGAAVDVHPLDNDVAEGEPALDPTTLHLRDSSGATTDIVTTPQGVFVLNDGTITFTPSAGFAGDVDPVEYEVTNVNGVVSSASIHIRVIPADDGAGDGGNGGGEGGGGVAEGSEPPAAGGTSAQAGRATNLAATGSDAPVTLALVGLGILLIGATLLPLSRLRRHREDDAA
ncbi:leucine-rich repeat domain-containing protein [Microbacterium sp. NPDC090225]|uniref:leucine-rich repeat domain-containing protein n=1 Tax=Microbacterium sp. NPDC090225 TaxID=3364207 RepID=UPI0037FAF78F